MNKLDTLVRSRVMPNEKLPYDWCPSTNATDMMTVLQWLRNRWGGMQILFGLNVRVGPNPDEFVCEAITLHVALCCAACLEVGVDAEDITEALEDPGSVYIPPKEEPPPSKAADLTLIRRHLNEKKFNS